MNASRIASEQPGPERHRQQPFRLHEVADRQGHRDPGEHHRQRWRPESSRRLDRGQHDHQHPGEHERVDHPGGAEQQRERGDVLGLQQQERGAHEEQVGVRPHVAERAAEHPHADQRDQQDAGQRPQVDRRDRAALVVQERPVVRRGRDHRAGRPRRASRRTGSTRRAPPSPRPGRRRPCRRTGCARTPPARCPRAGRSASPRGSSCTSRTRRPASGARGPRCSACSVNRKLSSRICDAPVTRASESGSANRIRSYLVSVVSRNARPSLTCRVTRGSAYGRSGFFSTPMLHDPRVDVDGVDVLRALRQRDRHVRAGAGADDQHVAERVAGRPLVRQPVLRLLPEPGAAPPA